MKIIELNGKLCDMSVLKNLNLDIWTGREFVEMKNCITTLWKLQYKIQRKSYLYMNQKLVPTPNTRSEIRSSNYS